MSNTEKNEMINIGEVQVTAEGEIIGLDDSTLQEIAGGYMDSDMEPSNNVGCPQVNVKC